MPGTSSTPSTPDLDPTADKALLSETPADETPADETPADETPADENAVDESAVDEIEAELVHDEPTPSFLSQITFPSPSALTRSTLATLGLLVLLFALAFLANSLFAPVTLFLLDTHHSLHLLPTPLLGAGMALSGLTALWAIFRQRTTEGGLTSLGGDTPELGAHVERRLQVLSALAGGLFVLFCILLSLAL